MAANDFVTWWFDSHPFWSTVITPSVTFAWCIWKGEVVRGVIAFLLLSTLQVSAQHRTRG